MSWLNLGLNISVLLVCCVFAYISTPLLNAKVKRITIVTMLALYSVLYLIGQWIHTQELNAITIRSNGVSIHLVGVLILAGVTVLIITILYKLKKLD